MAEYIEREEVRRGYEKLVRSYVNGYPYIADFRFDEMIENLSASDVAPVVHGRWIFKQDKEFPCFGKAICSECRNVISISPDLLDVDYQRFFAGQKHYCYNCGAKMESEGE